jgi:hypothetical protein
MPAPGFSYRRYGWLDVTTFLVGHLVFGGLLGLCDGIIAISR